MNLERNSHWDEVKLESYSIGTLPGEEASQLEEHLLLCESCRNRLSETDTYVRAMRSAGKSIREQEQRRATEPRRAWLFPRLAPALAAAVLVLGIGLTLRTHHTGGITPVAVTLEATRGGGLVAQAPAGKPLTLKPNLDGLPGDSEYHIRLLDQTGKRVWEGNFKPASGATAPEQAPGIYFVELYSLSGTLLREYVMEAKAAR